MPTGVRSTQSAIYGRNAMGMPICNANLRGGRGKCTQTILMGNGRCKLHGGSKPGQPVERKPGRIDPLSRRDTVVSGLPDKLRTAFEQSMNDPAQLSLRIEIGLMDANLSRILAMLQGTPSPKSWRNLRMLSLQLGLAVDSRNIAKIRQSHAALKKMIEEGNAENDIWNEMQSSMLQRAKITDAETKRLATAKSTLSIQEAESMIVTIFHVMSEHIADIDTLRAIKDDFVRRMAVPEDRMQIAASDDDIEADEYAST